MIQDVAPTLETILTGPLLKKKNISVDEFKKRICHMRSLVTGFILTLYNEFANFKQN